LYTPEELKKSTVVRDADGSLKEKGTFFSSSDAATADF
jgi:hypothetical protein